MKLVMFGIDQDKNLIIQFPMFVQPYTQTKLTLYQIETVPMAIPDAYNNAQSYTQLVHQSGKTINSCKQGNVYFLMPSRAKYM